MTGREICEAYIRKTQPELTGADVEVAALKLWESAASGGLHHVHEIAMWLLGEDLPTQEKNVVIADAGEVGDLREFRLRATDLTIYLRNGGPRGGALLKVEPGPFLSRNSPMTFERPQFEPTQKYPIDWGGTYATGGSDDCEHERVFSGEFFACANPAWSWICPKCGRMDVCQFVDADVKPEIDLPRFARLMLELRGDRYWVDWLARREQKKTPPTA